ncbi:hypothetical protein BGX24_011310 [Mortierella sp. AD032]|nr:hypothetical protein BGX24_011310 [Mortierella sp. AD032]
MTRLDPRTNHSGAGDTQDYVIENDDDSGEDDTEDVHREDEEEEHEQKLDVDERDQHHLRGRNSKRANLYKEQRLKVNGSDLSSNEEDLSNRVVKDTLTNYKRLLETGKSDTSLRGDDGSSSRFPEGDNADAAELLNDGRELDEFTPKFISRRRVPGELYMMTATHSKASVFLLPRNRVLPPAHLQRQLFPFIERLFEGNSNWTTWIDNVMMDRPEETNRTAITRKIYNRMSGPTIRLGLLLARLRRVILQDFAVMMVSADIESSTRDTRKSFVHNIAVKHPVLSSLEFLEYASYLRDSMAERSPELSRTSTVRSIQSDKEVLRLLVQQRGSAITTDEEGKEEFAVDAEEELAVDGVTESATHSRHENQGPEQPSTIRAGSTQFPANAVSQTSNVDSDIIQHDIQELRDRVASLEKDVLQLSNQNNRHQHHASGHSSAAWTLSPSDAITLNADPALLLQEIHRLRNRLAIEEQEKREAVEAATLAIEAATMATEEEEALNNRVAEMEQSVHGIWTMMAQMQADKYTADSRGMNLETMGQQTRQSRQNLLMAQLESFRKKFVIDRKAKSRS